MVPHHLLGLKPLSPAGPQTPVTCWASNPCHLLGLKPLSPADPRPSHVQLDLAEYPVSEVLVVVDPGPPTLPYLREHSRPDPHHLRSQLDRLVQQGWVDSVVEADEAASASVLVIP